MRDSARALYQELLADLSEDVEGSLVPFFRDNPSIDFLPDMSPRQVAIANMQRSFYKKYVDSVKHDADAKALSKFLTANEQCGTWELRLENTWDEVLVGTLKRVLYEFFYSGHGAEPIITSFRQLLERGRLGPGASVGARGGDFYTKLFASPLSSTARFLYDEYRRYTSVFPDWADAERQRCSEYGEVCITDSNRICFVPKTDDVSRVIFIEPSLNMFFQLGLEDILRSALDRFFGINLQDQQFKNRELARRGSATGAYATIDLSSASDTIGLKMLREILPANVFAWFDLLRCPKSVIGSERVTLNMLSTMGNGYTFPIQTVIFSCIVEAASRVSPQRYPFTRVQLERPRGNYCGNFGVNGDDIIVPSLLVKDVLRLLKLLGFTVNDAKTFVEGPFRESCGGDYFSGHPVRGVYIKRLDTTQSRFAAFNALTRWSAVTGIEIPRTLHFLLRTIPKTYVPSFENDDAGIKVPFSVVSKRRRDPNTQQVLYTRHVFAPTRLLIKDASITVPSGHKKRIYNPNGLLISFLRGSLEGSRLDVVKRDADGYIARCRLPRHNKESVHGTISVRHDWGKYRTKQAVASPHWNWINPDPRVSPWLAEVCGVAPHTIWQWWESTVESVLT